MIHDRGSVNCIDLAIRRVSERLKAGGLDSVLSAEGKLAAALDEIADEIARIASGEDERENAK